MRIFAVVKVTSKINYKFEWKMLNKEVSHVCMP